MKQQFLQAVPIMLLTLLGFSTVNAQCTYFTQLISWNNDHTLGIKSDGTLWAWGRNNNGQLGDGTTTQRNIPTPITTATNWVSVASGFYHSLGIKNDGTLWAWGENYAGKLGDGTTTTRYIPTQIGTATNWLSVSAGNQHSLGIKSDGTLWAWGNNLYGQLGDGTTTSRSIPTQIGSATWLSVAAGPFHNLGLKSDGTLWVWGNNLWGQLGDGTTTSRSIPTQIGTATNWVTIATGGGSFSLGIKSDGTLWAWGQNMYGQLGDGTTTTRYTPTRIGTANNWLSVAAGTYYSLGIKSNGTAYAWGLNNFGQLGDGTIFQRHAPTQIGTNWVSVIGGGFHSLGRKKDGSAYAWGINVYGALGDGTTTGVTTPKQISSAPNFTLPAVNSSSTQMQANFTIYHSSCNLIANVMQTGGSTALSGSTTAKVWLAATQPVAYGKRHYEIIPAANATTATGRVTLFYTQQEFTDFNAVNIVKLPIDAIDAANNKNNVRIEERGGTSADGTGLPDTYSGTITIIDPADGDIVWNSTDSRWEITFDVTGFGGFFVKTQTTPLLVSNTLDKVGLTNSTLASPAYSLRLLSSTYAGNAIAVRRSSDNATQNIGFTPNGDLDTTSLKTFVGAHDGYVTKWYDQSGYEIDAVQTMAASQPYIVKAGIVERINQRPAVYFGTALLATAAQTIFTTAASMVGVAKGNSTTPSAFITKCGTAAGNNNNYPSPFDYTNDGSYFTVGSAATPIYVFIHAGNSIPKAVISNEVPASVYSFVIPAFGTYYNYVNGVQAGSQTVTVFADDGNALMIGNRSDGGSSGNFWTPEIILFNSVLSNLDRHTVEALQTAYYLTSSPLPLKWLSLKGQLTNNNAVRITWQVNEQQVKSYHIEKSNEGVSYTTIGHIPSIGDGSNNYSFTEPQMLSGTGFYRIRQTDLDGRFTYSPVIKLANQAESQVTVFPNPAKDFVTVTVGNNLLNSVATLHDATGKIIQSFTIPTTSFIINLENYPAGIYFLKTAEGKVNKIIMK